jgi:hypothetical protein
MKHDIGDLINWHELYDDFIVKNGGTGVVLAIKEFVLGEHSHTQYKIYRNKLNDIAFLGQENVHKLQHKRRNK